ncbi:alkaline phosphatase [Paracoccus sp. MC1854]|uniref:alkaline phosphatase n=1 Tax=Paracoccus sp. MC1854 TaxID=2760306 RepID=UPI001601EBFF|nr:alkaline phosphatase [Paracoccus sp. MC1854]MBB1493359.1 alkaline phosphatase [Paracoccus sp. MC1854]
MLNENHDLGVNAAGGIYPGTEGTTTSVIFMVPDGFGDVAAEAYEFYKGSAPLWKSGFQILVETSSASRPIPDSASAATAYATGVKTNNGSIAVDVDGTPLVSVLTLAHEAGKATGIVTTDAVAGATPAAFGASNEDRDNRTEIAQDYIDRGELTVILGGGREDFWADPDQNGITTLHEAKAAGFDYVTTANALNVSEGERLLGLFNFGPLGLPLGDRSSEPTLAEMTETALDRLGTDEDGFFLVVEAAGTDTWAHAHDAASVMRAAEEYENAMQVAVDYAEKNPGILVVSVADHETGGMRLDLDGDRTPAVFQSYEAPYAEMFFEAAEAIADLGWRLSPRSVINAVQETVSDLTGGSVRLEREEIFSILNAAGIEDAIFDFSTFLNVRGGVEYTTTEHTDTDISLFAFGPGANRLEGRVDNTEVGLWLADAMGLSFPAEQNVADADFTSEIFQTAGESWADSLM